MKHFGIFALAIPLFIAPGLHAAGETSGGAQAQTEKQKGKPPARRSVPARLPDTIAVPPPATQPGQPAISLPRPAPPAQPAQADRPIPLTACDAGGCRDTAGNQYNSGAGNTYLNSAGRPCTRHQGWMQCF